jgi:hypothetical protein
VKLREAEEQLHPLLKVREQKYLYWHPGRFSVLLIDTS